MTLDAETLRRAERAHYDLQLAGFLGERREIPGASLFTGAGITDPDWNHAGLLDLDAARLGETLELVRRHYRALGLPAAVVASPFSRPPELPDLLERHGFAPAFQHVWHFVGGDGVAAVELEAGAEIREVRNEAEMRDFVELFERVYSVDLETGAPVEPPAGYAGALMESFRRPHEGLDVVHYLALVGSIPAGIATSIHGHQGEHGSTSGLYNLAVLSEFRRRGLGAALVRRRGLDALERGQRIVFLQTERESVERRLVRHGFVKGFTSTGYVERS